MNPRDCSTRHHPIGERSASGAVVEPVEASKRNASAHDRPEGQPVIRYGRRVADVDVPWRWMIGGVVVVVLAVVLALVTESQGLGLR